MMVIDIKNIGKIKIEAKKGHIIRVEVKRNPKRIKSLKDKEKIVHQVVEVVVQVV